MAFCDLSKRSAEQMPMSRGVSGAPCGIKRSGCRSRGSDAQTTWWMVPSFRALASGTCIHNKA